MKLTFWNRLKICFEVLTIRSGHRHTAQEKQLSTFKRGYDAGRHDEQLEQLCVAEENFFSDRVNIEDQNFLIK